MNCGNPLYSDAVTAGGGASGARALAELWSWALAAAVAAFLLLLLLAALPLWLRRRGTPPPAPGKAPPKPKLSNLEAVSRRERPASCAEALSAPPPAPLNNVDTLRSYGSAGDELEGIPPDYRRNLNIDVGKPWSEQMHLHTFVDNKIYNDLKGTLGSRSPGARRLVEPHLVGGYHWDCSDWCGGVGALPGISEVAGSERPDSSEPECRQTHPNSTDDLHTHDTDHLQEASSCLLHPDSYLPPCLDAGEDCPGGRRLLREPDAASLITMLEERTSLLGGGGSVRSGSSLSARLCEISDSEGEEPPPARHTDV